MRITLFECSKHSSFLLWKKMGVEGEDPKNAALLSVLCYSADNSADIQDGACNEKADLWGQLLCDYFQLGGIVYVLSPSVTLSSIMLFTNFGLLFISITGFDL